jgi:hypothetical protein
MKNKMKYIPNDYYDKLSESVRNELLEYRRTSSLIKRKEKSLIKKLENIKILQKEIRLLKSEETKLYNNVKIFTDDLKSEFNMRYNSSVQSIKDKFRYEVFDNITERITDNYKSFMNDKLGLEDII